ncbi:hypothetical protein [Burkholderia glumae]|uniref:hypothetical protein n=1 Tax=Burkholderia glumae TaxID=337 RepID=UPI0020372D83|nr:hypothetical protein [Burkholderia glumae]MCM2546223.1 hypothetical protein [Burkholderia glumae]
MAIMSVKDALTAVLKDIEAMSAEELRAEHEANMHGDIAIAMRELCAFVGVDIGVYDSMVLEAEAVSSYPVAPEVEAVSIPDAMAIAVRNFPQDSLVCGNDAAFALAA